DAAAVTIEAARSEHFMARDALLQPVPVCALETAVVLAMPQMQDAGGERAFLAARAMGGGGHRESGVLGSPSFEFLLEAVDHTEVRHPDAEIAGAHALPAARGELAQRPERIGLQRLCAIDIAARDGCAPLFVRPLVDRRVALQHQARERLGKQDAV